MRSAIAVKADLLAAPYAVTFDDGSEVVTLRIRQAYCTLPGWKEKQGNRYKPVEVPVLTNPARHPA